MIIGFGSSGKWAYNLAVKQGYVPIVYDDQFFSYDDIGEELLQDLSFAIVSPAIPMEHKIIQKLKSLDTPIISEIEFAYYFKKPKSKIVGVTGTNGKTTVVRLINSILNEKTVVAGNIGVPYSKVVGDCEKTVVLELSSFQLQNIIEFAPDIAVFTNFAPDHLDYHKNFEEYKSAKLNLIRKITIKGKIIYNYDDDELRKEIRRVSHKNIYYVSMVRRSGNGIFIEGNEVKIVESGKEVEILNINEVGKRPTHEILNILTSVLVSYFFGADREMILSGLNNFKPSPYRQQETANGLGIKIINDSKSTNLASTIVALKAFDGEKVLIVGGKPKNEDYSRLFLEDFRLAYVVAYGESRSEFLQCAKHCGFKNVTGVETLSDALSVAIGKVKLGDTLLFSPACSSFDQFNSYLERGECFDKLVSQYK